MEIKTYRAYGQARVLLRLRREKRKVDKRDPIGLKQGLLACGEEVAKEIELAIVSETPSIDCWSCLRVEGRGEGLNDRGG
ncbi:hypothetical protein DPEC_G00043600 [Dallia pectoralis]|uniref:Uncharacterized protein n=1 Tax=Dallia pectoralis TaxID=75939 RepID=A0ACC2H9M6_DALPE|nr:hypothetical protein DPEC_G00043600 [Dallia pectoralis]